MSAIDPTISIEVISGSHLAYQVRFVVPDGKGDLSEIVETLPLAYDAPLSVASLDELVVPRFDRRLGVAVVVAEQVAAHRDLVLAGEL